MFEVRHRTFCYALCVLCCMRYARCQRSVFVLRSMSFAMNTVAIPNPTISPCTIISVFMKACPKKENIIIGERVSVCAIAFQSTWFTNTYSAIFWRTNASMNASAKSMGSMRRTKKMRCTRRMMDVFVFSEISMDVD